jgi:hypothetical protein
MQPYFFPYPGYFSLIKHTALFILLDAVQMRRHGWIERNRILKPGEGWQYIRAPLTKHAHKARISEVQINNDEPWKRRLLAQLEHYRKRAPFYDDVMLLLQQLFARDFATIVDLDHAALGAVCDYLGIGTPVRVFSQMGLEVPPALAPDDWALNICRAVPGADEYWNPPGGVSFFDPDKYAAGGVRLRFHSIIPSEYDQRGEAFEPGLSILDAMMFNSPAAINEMLDQYELS